MIQKICSPVHLHDGILHKALTQAVDNDSRSLFLCPPARWHYKQSLNASSGRMIQKTCFPVHLHDGIINKASTQAVEE
jgi:hypothetical protein